MKPTTNNVLLIDDDQELGQMLCDFLATEQLRVSVAESGESGLDALDSGDFQLVILDIMLPGKNGIEVLKEIRTGSNVPIIMLTARGEDIDRIIGLEFGADDYLAKPFNPRELAARIKAILRRLHSGPREREELKVGEIRVDPKKRTVTVNSKTLRLTGTEYEVLCCLIETPGTVVTKEQLSERALGRRLMPYDRSIDTHISNLRGKLVDAGVGEETITNQRGVGYVILPGR